MAATRLIAVACMLAVVVATQHGRRAKATARPTEPATDHAPTSASASTSTAPAANTSSSASTSTGGTTRVVPSWPTGLPPEVVRNLNSLSQSIAAAMICYDRPDAATGDPALDDRLFGTIEHHLGHAEIER